jgi:hypothetical protein
MYFYYDGMPDDEFKRAVEYVVPMQHNFDNPLNRKGAKDTFIEYWIVSDDRLTQDYIERSADKTRKLVVVDLRFLGVEAETWAKAFHHLTKRPGVAGIFAEVCGATMLEYTGSVRPVNIDYFGVGNSSIAFDLTIQLQYVEAIELAWKPLEYISVASGEIISGGIREPAGG